jgi:hypothetical protein
MAPPYYYVMTNHIRSPQKKPEKGREAAAPSNIKEIHRAY